MEDTADRALLFQHSKPSTGPPEAAPVPLALSEGFHCG